MILPRVWSVSMLLANGGTMLRYIITRRYLDRRALLATSLHVHIVYTSLQDLSTNPDINIQWTDLRCVPERIGKSFFQLVFNISDTNSYILSIII